MSVNWKGVRYRIQRWFGVTDYDREQRKKKETTDLSMTEGLIDSLQIAPLTDLPISLGARVAYLVYFFLVCAMVFFLLQGFITARKEKFLALSPSAGVCVTVPRVVSGVYKLDVNGNWQGSEHFEVTQSIYELTLNGLQFTNEEFATLIQTGLAELNRYGAIAADRPLADALVFWMAWAIDTVASANRQHFRLTGDAKTLYNQGTTHLSGMSSLHPGRCNVSSSITFEKGSGIYRIRYSYDEFSRSEACMQVADPRSLNFEPELGTDDFTLELDVQSVMTAMGVNYGMIDADVLQEVPFTRGVVDVNGTVRGYAQFFNEKYPNMNPITCFTFNSSSKVDTCSIEIGVTPLYPVLNHIGYSPSDGGAEGVGSAETLFCSCSEEVTSDAGLSVQCETFLMMTGFVFYYADYDDTVGSVPSPLVKLSKLTDRYAGIDGKTHLNIDAYNISKDAIHFSEEDGYFSSSDRESFFDFCTVDAAPCSILTIYSVGTTKRHGISEYYYQLPHGHCNDSITLSPEAQAKMELPPIPLTENYLECRRTLTSALFASGGIAVGNVLSVKSVLVLFFTFWLARYTARPSQPTGTATGKGGVGNNRGKSRSRYTTYGMVERDKVLQYFAFNLLLARDGKYRGGDIDAGDGHKDSFVKNLAAELETHPHVKRFFLADEGATVIEEHQNSLRSSGEGVELMPVSTPSAVTSATTPASREQGLISSVVNSSFLVGRNENAFEDEVLPNPLHILTDSTERSDAGHA